MNGAASDVASFLQAKTDPSQFGGVRITPDGVELSIVGSESDSVKQAVIQSHSVGLGEIKSAGSATTASSVPVTIRKVGRTYAELEAVNDQLTKDHGYWSKQGIDITRWGPNIGTNTVKIAVSNVTPDTKTQLKARYGDAISIENSAGYGQRYSCSTTNRQCDQSPWTGGDDVYTYGGSSGGQTTINDCSSAFNYQSGGPPSGYDYARVTAGHCISNGPGLWQNVYNGSNLSNQIGTTLFGNYDVETAGGDDWGGFSLDSNANGSYIWRNLTATGTRHVSSAKQAVEGGQLCTDGMNNAQICYFTVTDVGIQIEDSPGVWDTNVVVMTPNSGTTTGCYYGDSGAAVYKPLSDERAQTKGIVYGGYPGAGAVECWSTDIVAINGHMAQFGYSISIS